MNLTQPQAERTKTERWLFWGARGLASAAAAVALASATLLAMSWWTGNRATPSDVPAMKTLMKQIGADPKNAALRDQARDLDVLARGAYLESVAFRQRGSLLLLVACGVLLGSLKVMSGVRSSVPNPATRDDDSRDARATASGTVLCFLAFVGGLAYVYASSTPGYVARPTAAVAAAPSVVPAPVATPLVAPPTASIWPAFRGWSGLSTNVACRPPTDWDAKAGRNVRWKTKVPLRGFNSPVVWGDRVYLSGADAQQRVVFGFDSATGALLWSTAVRLSESDGKAPEVTPDTGHAASTMACDGRGAYAVFANGDLVAVDPAGKIRWSKNLGLPDLSYGYASSLLVHADTLFVQFDAGQQAALLALDAATGKERWSGRRPELSSWCSPILADRAGKPAIVANGSGYLMAYAADTGDILWDVKGVTGEVAPSPASADGLVVITMFGSGCQAFSLADGSPKWTNSDVEAPEVTSPVVADGRVFVLSDNGTLVCLSAATGESKWTHEFDAKFFASPVIVNGRLYLADLDGVTHVLEAADVLKEVGKGSLGEPCSATPAFVDDRIYLRGEDHLFCIGSTTP